MSSFFCWNNTPTPKKRVAMGDTFVGLVRWMRGERSLRRDCMGRKLRLKRSPFEYAEGQTAKK